MSGQVSGQVPAHGAEDDQDGAPPGREAGLLVYLLLGIALGIVFIKGEVASWFRIQEMFRFQSVFMYGVIGTAVTVGVATTLLMKRRSTRAMRGGPIDWPDAGAARPTTRHMLGGTVFGLGWGLAGACPGPIYALLGSGLPVFGVGLLAAVAGAWMYGWARPHLPH